MTTSGPRLRYAVDSKSAAGRPRGPRAAARAAARGFALSLLARVSRPDSDPFLRPLYCHYVFDDQVDDFRRIIEELRKTGRFVDTATCVSMARGETPITGQNYHLSFDDGLRNVFSNALPVLRGLGVPAIVFVATSVVGVDWDTAREYCLDRTGYSEVIELATWDDLVGAVSQGFEIGSHTRTHAALSRLSAEEELESEIAGSKRDIEEHLGIPCPFLSWPYGTLGDISSGTDDVVARAGYAGMFSAVRGSIRPGSPAQPYRIPRHHFETGWPLSHIRYFASGHWEHSP